MQNKVVLFFHYLINPFRDKIHTYKTSYHYRRIRMSKIAYQNVPYQKEAKSYKVYSKSNSRGFFAPSAQKSDKSY